MILFFVNAAKSFLMEEKQAMTKISILRKLDI